MKNYTLRFNNGRIKHFFLFAIAALLVFTGCKKDDDGPVRYTNIKVVNAMNEATGLDIYLDDDRKRENLMFGESTEYFEVTEGSHRVEATPTGSRTAKISINQKFDGDAKFSVFAINNNEALVVPDTVTTPPSSEVWVRYVNLSPAEKGANGNDATYIIKLDGSSASFDFAAQPYKQKSNLKKYTPNTYSFTALDFGNASGASATTGAVSLVGGKIYTIFLSGKASANTLALNIKE